MGEQLRHVSDEVERMKQLDHNYAERTAQTRHVSGEVGPKSPSVTVSLFNDLLESASAERAHVIQELSETKAQLKTALTEISRGKNEEEGLQARIARLASEKRTLREVKQRLETKVEQDAKWEKVLEETVRATQEKSASILRCLYETFRTVGPILQRHADASEEDTVREAQQRLEKEHAGALLEEVVQKMADLKCGNEQR